VIRLTLLGLVALAACEEHRIVTLQFGPNDHTLSSGFSCRDDAGEPLILRARRGTGFTFQIVIDSLDLGTTYPGYRGEELIAACAGGGCRRFARYCSSVAIAAADITSPTAILGALRAQLGHPELIGTGPSSPIVVRAVATQQPCSELEPPDGSLPGLDPALAIGCAYSCPVVLDNFRGSLGLALDTLDERCASQVAGCARFAP
jgi:hypothetical protein